MMVRRQTRTQRNSKLPQYSTGAALRNYKQDSSESQKKRRRRYSQGTASDDEATETFEAEGQCNQMMADRASLTEEEEYLRGIWDSLGVGQTGCISLAELSKVCSHIGMDEMNDEELQQLFDKLDADGDGRVSFQEFLQELFQHNTPTTSSAPTTSQGRAVTPRSLGASPARALSSQKKLLFRAPSGNDDRMTPSIVQGSGVSGLFTTIDADRTGFAKPDAITDLWEKYNVTNGTDVLLALGFDVNAKVNLSELSSALEQELVGTDEQNMVFQAATCSFQQEMRHLKSCLEQAAWAKDKLRLDLSEANSRNSILVKEVDEQHATMEKSSETKLLSIEKKYQEQVKSLQGDLDHEREQFTAYTTRHKLSLDSEMGELKQEEVRLRDQLLQAQKEMEKLGHDLEETAEKLDEAEKQNLRFQRELETVDDLHRKLADYESKGMLSPEEQQFTQDKVQRLEFENKDLKDMYDELTTELEHVKQQSIPTRKLSSTPGSPERGGAASIPVREGSVLADYIRPVLMKQHSTSSPDFSDDEARSGGRFPRRFPTPTDDDNISIGSTADKEIIEQLRRDLQEVKDNFETERKEIEQACRLEIVEIEERHDQEKGDLLKKFDKDKSQLVESCERRHQQALAELRQELLTEYVLEKEALIQRYESERNHIEQTAAEENTRLTQRLSAEYEEDMEAQMLELKTVFGEEISQLKRSLSDSKETVKKLESKNTELEKKLLQQREELEKSFKREKSEMEDLFGRHMQNLEDVEKEKHDLELKFKKHCNNIELQFDEEKLEMSGQIERQRLSVRELQGNVAGLELELKLQKDELELKFKKQCNDMEAQFADERLEMNGEVDRQRQGVRELQGKVVGLELELKQQKGELELVFQQEQQEIKKLYETRAEELEGVIQQYKEERTGQLKGGVDGLKGKTREEFFQLLETMKTEAIQKERDQLMESLHKEQIEMETNLETRHSELSHMLEKEKTELVDRYEGEIRALRQEMEQLQGKMAKERETLTRHYEAEREGIEDLLALQIREELEDEIYQQVDEIREAFDQEKLELEAETQLLRDEVNDLQRTVTAGEDARRKVDELTRSNNKLQQELRTAERSHTEKVESLESENNSLELRIQELMVEQEGAVTAVKAEMVESSKQQSHNDKAAYDTVVSEREALESRVSQLTQQAVSLQSQASRAEHLQESVESLSREKIMLQERVAELARQVDSGPKELPEHAQRAISELTREKSVLDERLVVRQAKLQELEDMAKKYTDLQFDYDQLGVGLSALEEQLLETQESLVDTQATLTQAEAEIKDLLKVKDKVKLVQKKHEEACKERDKAVKLAKALKEQLSQASSARREDHEDKGRITMVLEEKKQLETQLQKVSDKLLEATTNFAVSQSQHIRELQQWKDQSNNLVDLQKYTKLQIELVDNQRSLRDLQESISIKEDVVNKKFQDTVDNHTHQVKTLDEQKSSIVSKLKTLQEVLDNQIVKFREQYDAGEKRNALVVDLYKENSELMDALYHVEEQKKDAVSRCYKLEDQCKTLRKMLKKVARVAIS